MGRADPGASPRSEETRYMVKHVRIGEVLVDEDGKEWKVVDENRRYAYCIEPGGQRWPQTILDKSKLRRKEDAWLKP